MGGTAVVGRNHAFANSMLVRSSGVTTMCRKAVPTRSNSTAIVSTANGCLLPNTVSSRIRFHRPKLARGNSVTDRDHTTMTNKIAAFVSVPGAGPRAAALTSLR